MTYSLVWNPLTNAVSEGIILRDEDSAYIPFDPANVDYQAYLAWLDEGNQPNAATQPPTPRPG